MDRVNDDEDRGLAASAAQDSADDHRGSDGDSGGGTDLPLPPLEPAGSGWEEDVVIFRSQAAGDAADASESSSPKRATTLERTAQLYREIRLAAIALGLSEDEVMDLTSQHEDENGHIDVESMHGAIIALVPTAAPIDEAPAMEAVKAAAAKAAAAMTAATEEVQSRFEGVSGGGEGKDNEQIEEGERGSASSSTAVVSDAVAGMGLAMLEQRRSELRAKVRDITSKIQLSLSASRSADEDDEDEDDSSGGEAGGAVTTPDQDQDQDQEQEQDQDQEQEQEQDQDGQEGPLGKAARSASRLSLVTALRRERAALNEVERLLRVVKQTPLEGEQVHEVVSVLEESLTAERSEQQQKQQQAERGGGGGGGGGGGEQQQARRLVPNRVPSFATSPVGGDHLTEEEEDGEEGQ